MSELVETIKQVAAFADLKEDKTGLSRAWNTVQFRKGEVYAQSSGVGGARAPIDLELECSVSAAKLLKALKAVKGEPQLSCTKSRLTIKSGKTKAVLPTSSIKEAPTLYRPKGVDWHHTSLSGIERVLWCVSTDHTRLHLYGVYMGAHGLEATNGHALCRLNSTDYTKALGSSDGLLVPPQVVKDLPDEVWMAVKQGLLFIATDEEQEHYRICNLIDAQFPTTDQILGKYVTNAASAQVSRGMLLDCLKRAKISAEHVVLDIKAKSLTVDVSEKTQPTSLFDFADSVPLEDSTIKPIRIGVSAEYMIPLVDRAASSTITLRVSGDLAPVVIEDGDYLGVVMPVRL